MWILEDVMNIEISFPSHFMTNDLFFFFLFTLCRQRIYFCFILQRLEESALYALATVE